MSYALYFALEKRLNQAGHHIDRADLIRDLTDGEKESLKALSGVEYAELMRWMRAAVDRLPRAHDEEARQRMRRKIIALFRQMGYEKPSGQGSVVADMKRIYGWVIKYGRFHKPLNKHSGAELAGLVSQVERMYDSWLSEIHK